MENGAATGKSGGGGGVRSGFGWVGEGIASRELNRTRGNVWALLRVGPKTKLICRVRPNPAPELAVLPT
jgi:hypothetical protein